MRAVVQHEAALRMHRTAGQYHLAVQARILRARCADHLTPGKRRTLDRFTRAEDSLALTAWLALRPARSLVGLSETLGTEGQLAKGLLWRRLARLRRGRAPGRLAYGLDASFPSCDPDSYSQKRLRRWRERRARR